jgi:hypothetical protein
MGMTMGLDRKLSRVLARKNGNGGTPAVNPLAALQKLQEAAQAAGGLHEALATVQGLVVELTASRGALEQALQTVSGLDYELMRQRAVFLRFLHTPDFIVTPGPEGITRFIATEERFRAEYDVLHAFVLLAERMKEDT